MGKAAEDGWEELLTEPAGLDRLVVAGHGKRSWLTLSLTQGRWVSVSAGEFKLAMEGKANLMSTVQAVDDFDLEISYTGEDIEVRSVRLCYWEGDQDFRAAVEEWQSAGMAGEIDYKVDAEIVIAQARD